MLCSLAGGAVLWLSVLYARTRKRMLKVHQLEGELMSADAELLEAQMSSQVREKNSLLITFPNLGRKSHRLHTQTRLMHQIHASKKISSAIHATHIHRHE